MMTRAPMTYYVYSFVDADEVVRYFGKGTGRRADTQRGKILALAAGASVKRASNVHHRFAADIRIGREFRTVLVAEGLSQADAYAMEARLIAKHRRETEGGTLWNVLAGGEGFQGILHEDWKLVAARAAETKKRSGADLRAGAKAAATKAMTKSKQPPRQPGVRQLPLFFGNPGHALRIWRDT